MAVDTPNERPTAGQDPSDVLAVGADPGTSKALYEALDALHVTAVQVARETDELSAEAVMGCTSSLMAGLTQVGEHAERAASQREALVGRSGALRERFVSRSRHLRRSLGEVASFARASGWDLARRNSTLSQLCGELEAALSASPDLLDEGARQELKALTDDLQRDVLQPVVEATAAVHQEAVALSERLSGHEDRVRAQLDSSERVVTLVERMVNDEAWLKTAHRHVMRGVSELQTQDPLVQMLRRIDPIMGTTLNGVHALTGSERVVTYLHYSPELSDEAIVRPNLRGDQARSLRLFPEESAATSAAADAAGKTAVPGGARGMLFFGAGSENDA